MKKRAMILAGLCVVGMIPLAAQGTPIEVVLQNGLNGYSGTGDNWMISQYNTDTNMSGGRTIDVESYYSQLRRRGLISFDLSSIPVGQTIVSATLSLYCCSTNGNDDKNPTVSGARVKRSWSESQSTWNSYQSGSLWTSRTDGAAGATGTGDIESSGFTFAPKAGTWSNIDVTSDVQGWYNGAENWGWGLFIDGWYNWDNWVQFWNKNYVDDLSLRPKLTITYTPEPTMIGLLALGGLMLRARNRR